MLVPVELAPDPCGMQQGSGQSPGCLDAVNDDIMFGSDVDAYDWPLEERRLGAAEAPDVPSAGEPGEMPDDAPCFACWLPIAADPPLGDSASMCVPGDAVQEEDGDISDDMSGVQNKV